jgi:hypothetical protein
MNSSLLARVGKGMDRLAHRYLLGESPNPENWPPPDDVHALALPVGLNKSDDETTAWVIAKEYTEDWTHRRTPIGAQSYRFVENGEYDCGWRLADLAHRFVAAHAANTTWDIITIIPSPPVFTPTPVLEWTAERFARELGARFRPDLFTMAAPLRDHPDRLRKLPMPLADLLILSHPEFVFAKKMILADWRWEQGRVMTVAAKLLRRAGAEVFCLAWLG